MLIRFKQKMYGDYTCSCGCGKQLDGICYGVGQEEDEEGFDWRMFTKECWDSTISNYSKEYIYNNYKEASLNA